VFDPFDPFAAILALYDQAERVAVFFGQRLAIHRMSKESLSMEDLSQFKLLAIAVERVEGYFACAFLDSRLVLEVTDSFLIW
jgi:hypothetical protein